MSDPINVRTLAPGTRIVTTDGAVAEIVSNPADGVWLFARYIESPGDPALVGHWLVEAVTGLVTTRGVPLLPGAAELLAEVAAAGVARALVTSAQRRFMTAVLAATGLEFALTVCGEDVSRGKPDPEPYLRDTFADGFAFLKLEAEGARGNPTQDLVLLRRD